MIETLEARRTALLVMDYQVGIMARLAETTALLQRTSAAIADVRRAGGHIGWVRVAFTDSDFDAIPPQSVMARMATADRRAALHIDSPTSQLHDGLHPEADDIAVRKTRVGAFTTTDLDRRLRERGLTAVVLAGISTSGVVLSTVREAMDRDYRIVVLEDACADPDPEVHAFLTGRVFPGYATVVGADALARLLA
jgi:nicotinamidase-related amidase